MLSPTPPPHHYRIILIGSSLQVLGIAPCKPPPCSSPSSLPSSTPVVPGTIGVYLDSRSTSSPRYDYILIYLLFISCCSQVLMFSAGPGPVKCSRWHGTWKFDHDFVRVKMHYNGKVRALVTCMCVLVFPSGKEGEDLGRALAVHHAPMVRSVYIPSSSS